MKNLRTSAASAFLALGVLALSQPAPALESLPAYGVTEIGSQLIAANPNVGYSVAMAVNESGDAVGMAVVDGMPTPFVYTAEHGPLLLPRLGVSADAVDLTDRDAAGDILIVGTADPGTADRREAAVLWIYSTVSGTVAEAREIGALPGFANSVATGVNNQWIVVGYSTNYELPGTQAMKYDVFGDLLASFDFPAIPADINDFGDVAGGGFVGDLNGNYTDLGAPAGTSLPYLVAINDLGSATGRATTSFSDGSGRMISAAVRHTGAGGWQVITANSYQDTGKDINYAGDVVGITGLSFSYRPFLYIDALGEPYLVDSLLADGFTDRFVTWVEGINDSGQIAGSGTGGAVLLSPVGALLPPPPPADLVATPHDATVEQPWIAITLGWTDTSDLETGFTIERSLAGAGAWEMIASSWTSTVFWDLNVEPGVTYDYRVAAVGTAGVSDYSNLATATAPNGTNDSTTSGGTDTGTAPGEPVDATAPTISILSPMSGEQVSGRVGIDFEAADDTGLAYVEITTLVDSSEYLVCGQALAGETSFTGSCNLNLRKIPAGFYTLDALVTDNAGNSGTAQVTIEVVDKENGKVAGCHPRKGC